MNRWRRFLAYAKQPATMTDVWVFLFFIPVTAYVATILTA